MPSGLKMEASVIFFLVFILTCALLFTVAAYVIYSGLFHKVEVGAGKPEIINTVIAYKFGRGPYRDTGSTFTEVTSIAPKLRCVGIYYDDPNQVPAQKLRWAVGSILSEGNTTPDPEITAMFKKNGFRFFHLPKVSSVVRSTFPERTSLSVLIGIFKVYPLLGEYVRINKLCAHPWMEVYDGKTIYYMAPLARQDEFYVPESLSDDYCDEGEEEYDHVMETVQEEPEPTPDKNVIGTKVSETNNLGVNGKGEHCVTASNTSAKPNDSADVACEKKPAIHIDSKCDVSHAIPDSVIKENSLDSSQLPGTGSQEIDFGKPVTQNGDIQDAGVSSSNMVDVEPPSPASSMLSASSSVSTETEAASASFYTSQSERSNSSFYSSQSEQSYSSYEPTTTTEFSSDSEIDTEAETPCLPQENKT